MLKLIAMPETVSVKIPLLPGVEIVCRPPTTALVEQVRHETRINAGFTVGVREELYTLALLKAAVISWTGVLDEAGNPAPVTDAYLEAFSKMHPASGLWRSEYISSIILRALEGEDFAPEPSGTSAEARDTAQGAETKTSPAPEENQ